MKKFLDAINEQSKQINDLKAEILNLHKALRDLADIEARPSPKFREKFPDLCKEIDEIYK